MKRIGLFFGGISNESEVSLSSAKNIIKHFDYKKYQLILIYRHKNGLFYIVKDINTLHKKKLLHISDFKKTFDIAFPITHGKYGEDGSLQGIFSTQKIKYCGCHVLSSALCMDKSLFKHFLSGHTIPQTKFMDIDFQLMNDIGITLKVQEAKKKLSLPLYVKPANSGSSVGISKISTYNQLNAAIKEANKHDSKILIEEGLISPREIEIAILGNKELKISEPGELVLAKDFYDYDDKYKNNTTMVHIPAKLSAKNKKYIIALAQKTYKLCDCSGFARIDFFIANNTIYLNEINTLPGFTDISMFPMLMMHQGMTYKKLINTIISLAY